MRKPNFENGISRPGKFIKLKKLIKSFMSIFRINLYINVLNL